MPTCCAKRRALVEQRMDAGVDGIDAARESRTSRRSAAAARGAGRLRCAERPAMRRVCVLPVAIAELYAVAPFEVTHEIDQSFEHAFAGGMAL